MPVATQQSQVKLQTLRSNLMDVLEQSLIDLGLCFNEYYNRYIQSGLTARSYTKQKYRNKYYAWLQVGEEIRNGVFEEGSFSTWPKRLLKSKTNSESKASREARKIFSVVEPVGKYRTLHVDQESIPVKHRQKKSQATTPDS